MTRQYIGARYVPRFFENSQGGAEWESGVAYEALTIVTYNGNSYTSKKTVPATIGNPSQNPNYWASTGIYNQQVEELRQQFVQLSEDVDGYSERLGVAETDIDNLESATERMTTRKVIFISDSFCSGNIGGSGLANGIFTTFCNHAGLTAGVDAKVYYQGGSGFIVHPNGKTYMDLCKDAVNEAFFEPDDVTDIMVVTAGNDGGQSMSDVANAWIAVRNYLHTNFKNAKIFIAVDGGTTDGSNRNQIRNVIQPAVYRNPAEYVLPIYNAMMPLWFFDSFSSDGIHPNGNGCDRIGVILARSFIEHTAYPRMLDFNYNSTLNTIEGEVTRGAQFTISPDCDTLRIRCTYSPAVASAVSATYNHGCRFKIGKVDNTKSFLVPNTINIDSVFAHIPADVYIYKTGESWVHIFGEIAIVKDTAASADVYFKAAISPENITNATLSMGENIASLACCGYT